MVMVDGAGRRLEVIVLDRGHGPQPYIRVSWHHHILLGRGYYRRGEMDQALALVDVDSLVEVIQHPAIARFPGNPATRPDRPARP